MVFCSNCGTQNEDGAIFCSCCGARLENYVAQTENSYATNTTGGGKGFAIASLVCSLVSCIPCFGILAISCSIAGFVFSLVAKNKGTQNGMTTAGTIISIITFCFWMLALIVILIAGITGSLSNTNV